MPFFIKEKSFTQTFAQKLLGRLAPTYAQGWAIQMLLILGMGGLTPLAQAAPTTVNKRISSGRLHTVMIRDDGTVWQWGYWFFAPMQATGLSNVISVAAGYEVNYALKADGTVWTWGDPRYAPTQVSGLSGVVGIYASLSNVAVVKSNGEVWTWGSNTSGQLGDGTTTDSSTPVQVIGLTGVVKQVSVGQSHMLALKDDGTVCAWGSNATGGLGNGTTTSSSTPVPVSTLTDVISIAADGVNGWNQHSLAVKSDGTVWAWGDNVVGQLGDGTTTQRLAPVQLSGISGVAEVEADTLCSMALKTDGTLWAWGNNQFGQLGDGTYAVRTSPVQVSGASGIVAMALGQGHAAAVRNDGAVFSWGLHDFGQLGDDNTDTSLRAVEIPGIDNVAKTSLGERHALALKKDGTVWAWGENPYGELGDNTVSSRPVPAPIPDLEDVVAVEGGSNFSLALKSDGTVWSWGYNQYGELGHGGWSSQKMPVQISDLTNVTAISSMAHHSLALKSDGTVWAWGWNGNGALGDNSTLNKHVPVQITGVGNNITAVAAGGNFSLALASDGTVWAWGWNSSGQLGDGTTTQRLTPVQVEGGNFDGVVAIACGGEHALALKGDGTVWAWGSNSQGQLDDGTTTNRTTPVRVEGLSGVVSIGAGSMHSFAVKSDGTLWIKGVNWNGQLGDGSEDHKILHASANMHSNVAVKETGTLISWGKNWYGIFGVGMPVHPNATTPVLVPGVNAQDDAPVVAITSPANNTPVTLGQSQTVTVSFTPGDGTAESVSLYYHGMLIGTDESAPYTFTFTPWTWGDFELNAVGLDSNGVYSNRSSRITVHTPYDSDSDALPDWWEQKYLSTLAQSGTGDADSDGVTNAEELAGGLFPNLWDSDGDGFSDGFEIAKSTDPLEEGSFPALAHVPGRKRIAAGLYHTVAIGEGGTVWAWGMNNIDEMWGDPSSMLSHYLKPAPVRIGTLTNVISVAVGAHHNVALKDDGTVWVWGVNGGWWDSNGGGILGDGTLNNSATPVQVTALSDIVAVAAGYAHTLALDENGTIWAWGANQNGQLGDGSTTQRLQPVALTTITGVKAIAAGDKFSLAIKESDGSVWAWGANGYGQLGNGTTTEQHAPVQVGTLSNAVQVACRGQWYGFGHAIALLSDGSVWTWGCNQYGELGLGNQTSSSSPQQVQGLSGIVEVDAGPWASSMALESDGTVWAWGFNFNGQLGNGTKTSSNTPVQVNALSNAVSIAAGYAHSAAIATDGKVYTWGDHVYAQLGDDSTFASHAPVQSTGVGAVKQVVTGNAHTLALKHDGTVLAWGFNRFHQLGDGTSQSKANPVPVTGLTHVIATAANAHHSVAVKDDGTVWAWGNNSSGQLGDGTTTNRSTPVQVSGITGASKVAAGYYHGLALKTDGKVRAWGDNSKGQLGDGTTITPLTSVEVSGLTNVTAIAAGGEHCLALKSDKTVWAWGSNYSGQLGNNSWDPSSVPVQVRVQGGGVLTDVIAVACGYEHSMALKSDGTLWVWGANEQGQLDDDTNSWLNVATPVSGLNDVVSIGAGEFHSLAVRSNGELWAKGESSFVGSLGDGSTGHHLTHVSGGGGFTVALKEDGTLIAFGGNGSGQFGEGLPWNIEAYSPVLVKGLNVLYEVPAVEITSPVSNPATMSLGQTQSVTVTEIPGETQLESVSLYHHGVLVGTDTTPPYTFDFTPWTYGNYELRAIGTDSLGLETARSPALSIQVSYDSDSDTLPDWWEIVYFSNLAQNGSGDPDNDGQTNVQESQGGTDPLDYYNGQTPQLIIYSGDGQNVMPDTVTNQPLIVSVRDALGDPLENAPVAFTVTSGGALLGLSDNAPAWSSVVEARTNAQGLASVWLKAGSEAGQVEISASAHEATVNLSATVVAKGPLEIPTDVKLLITGTNQASLTWTDNAVGETGYEIERRTGDNGLWSPVYSTTSNATSWADGAVPANSYVYYRVRTTDGTSTSPWGNVAVLKNSGDSDADGIPDATENTVGLDPTDWSDATGDLDGDGVPNVWEYALSTDMTDDASRPTPHVTVDPNDATPAKRTIAGAIGTLPISNVSPPYLVVVVKPGVYEERLSIAGGRRVALISDGSGSPPVIRGFGTASTERHCIEFLGDGVIDGFRITRKNGAPGFGVLADPDSARRMVRVANCIISGNEYVSGFTGGSGIEHKDGRLVVAHSSVVGNTRIGGVGSGLYSSPTTSDFPQAVSINSVYWNPASGSAPEIHHLGAAKFISCVIRDGGSWGGITADPLLNPRGYLTSGSPVRGTGAAGHAAPFDIDIEGRNATPDIGADEFVDLDADGIPDHLESGGDLLPNGDADGDGLSNLDEYQLHGSSLFEVDTDGDGLDDGDEVTAGTDPNNTDTDRDEMGDGFEQVNGLDPTDDKDRLEDADGDRIPNIWEFKRGTSLVDANDKPATDWIVSPAQAGTGIYKGTIQQAVDAVSTTTGHYAIIEVRPGTYTGQVITTPTRKILLLADQTNTPVELKAPRTSYGVWLQGEAVLDGFRITQGREFVTQLNACIMVQATGFQARLTNCTISNVESTSGAISMGSNRLTLNHVTLYGCNALLQQNAISLGGGRRLDLINSIIWNPGGLVTEQIHKSAGDIVNVTNCIIYGGEHGASGSDPQLNPRGYVTQNSPGINAGASSDVPRDIHGESRVGVPDLGVDEFIDSDFDGLPDWIELLGATDVTGDTDGDGISNLDEYASYGSDPTSVDTDGDGLDDGAEVSAETSLIDADSDKDMMPDGFEVTHGLDPLEHRDALDDEDGDRIPNVYEWANSTSPSDPSSTPAAHYLVDKAATVTATVKNTIGAAITAANATSDYKIITVKSGTYDESLTIGTRALLILGEKGFQPPKLSRATAAVYVNISRNHSMLDGVDLFHNHEVRGTLGVQVSGARGNYYRLANCRIRGHRNNSVSAVSVSGGELGITNCTINDNLCLGNSDLTTLSAMIYAGSYASVHLVNSIVWNPPLFSYTQQLGKSSTGTVQVQGSIILGGEHGAVGANPRIDPVFGMLRWGSPGIDSGVSVAGGKVASDFQNDPRTTSPDIGADEFVDSDNDQLPDAWEQHFYADLTHSGTDDTDGDGLRNIYEIGVGYDPTDTDTDNDGLSDLADALGVSGSVYAEAGEPGDDDGDGLSNFKEAMVGTNSNVADTNGDGLDDGMSLSVGFNPASNDTDGDGVSNLVEIANGTSPLLADSDGDGVNDGVDMFPLDAQASTLSPGPGDTTAPAVILTKPPGATLLP